MANTSSSPLLNGPYIVKFAVLALLTAHRADRSIYGGIGLGVGAVAVINMLALANASPFIFCPRMVANVDSS